MDSKKKKITVAELFAGVGGFRLGLEGWNSKSASSNYSQDMNSKFEVIWSNQWEPSTKIQHASFVYEERFGKNNHSNEDIATVNVTDIPDHDMLVGGFPCQDYSVATTLKNSKGLIGKKGVLWWSIHKILSEKQNKPKYLFLENVDRLLNSPSSQRGRDFAIILKSLFDLDYCVEWRVINAADYGMPQRRKRIFILAYHKQTNINKSFKDYSPEKWIMEEGVLANAFPVTPIKKTPIKEFSLDSDVVSISNTFNENGKISPFENSGIMYDGNVTTFKTESNYEGQSIVLRDILQTEGLSPDLIIPENDIDKWNYLKGAKREIRKSQQGFEYFYSEGGMIFPDPLDKPSRTIITGEGGKSPSRFKHVIQTQNGLRRLSPIELERLNMFPDNHTKMENITDTKRAFFMGNALVVGVIERVGIELGKKIENTSLVWQDSYSV